MEVEANKRDFPIQSDLESKLEANVKYTEEGNTSFFKTYFNGLNALSGVGLLSVPYALASGGWLSLSLIFVVAVTSFYTGILIKRCMEADSSIRTYPDIGERAFGKIGRSIIAVFTCTELYVILTGFLILEGDNLHNLLPNLEVETYGLKFGGKSSFVLIVALILLPSVWLDNLGILAYISAFGVLASIIILVSTFCVGATNEIGFHGKGKLLNMSGVPTAISLYSFCFCAHPVFPTLYSSIKKKHQFSKVLFLCFLSTTMTYVSMAIMGYLMFGSRVDSQITLNLPANKLSSKVATYTIVVSPLCKYALMLEPVTNSLEGWFPKYYKRGCFRILVKTILVATQVLIALLVPFFGYLMSLVGAFLSITTSIILPCVCYLKISGTKRRSEWVLVAVIMTLSIVTALYGTYTSLVLLIKATTLRH